MSRLSRRFLALFTVLALVALPTTGAAAATPGDVGTATTSLDILKLDIQGLPLVGDLVNDLDLGSLLSYASTDTNAERNARGNGEPFALSQLLAMGQEISANSRDNPEAGGESADVNGIGTVGVGQMRALVEDGNALSTIDALTASLTGVTEIAGLGVILPESGSQSTANGTQAAAQNGAVLTGLDLGLGDLLGLDLLENLDLGSLLGLLGDLELTELELDAVVGQLTGSLTDISSVTTTLDGLLGGLGLENLLGSIDGLVGQIDLLEGAIGDITGGLSLEEATALLEGGACEGLLAILPLCDNLGSFTDTAELLNVANLELAELEGLLDTVMGLVDTLTGLLEGLLGLVTGLLDTVTGLLDGLTGTDLLALDALTLGVSSAAGDDAHATAVCDAGGVSILGLGSVVDGCDALKSGLSGLPGTLTGLLGNLPIVSGVLDGVVDVGGLEIIENVGTDGDFQVSRAAVTPLNLGIDLSNLGLGLGGVDAGLLGAVDGLLGEFDLLGGLLGSSGGAFSAQSVEAQQVAGIGGLLGTVTGVVDSLLGGNLGGLGLPSLQLSGPGMESVSNFGAAAGHTTPIDATPPADPTPSGALPRTGGTGMGLALALMVGAGAVTWFTRRRLGPLAESKLGSGK
ncbi:MAG: hypothetical protein WD250_16975 [Egibacteraceae bacterium]